MDLIDNIGDACNVYLILIDKLIYTHFFFFFKGGRGRVIYFVLICVLFMLDQLSFP